MAKSGMGWVAALVAIPLSAIGALAFYGKRKGKIPVRRPPPELPNGTYGVTFTNGLQTLTVYLKELLEYFQIGSVAKESVAALARYVAALIVAKAIEIGKKELGTDIDQIELLEDKQAMDNSGLIKSNFAANNAATFIESLVKELEQNGLKVVDVETNKETLVNSLYLIGPAVQGHKVSLPTFRPARREEPEDSHTPEREPTSTPEEPFQPTGYVDETMFDYSMIDGKQSVTFDMNAIQKTLNPTNKPRSEEETKAEAEFVVSLLLENIVSRADLLGSPLVQLLLKEDSKNPLNELIVEISKELEQNGFKQESLSKEVEGTTLYLFSVLPPDTI